MKCKFCDQHFVDILKHILKNEACKAVYNVDHMMEERRLLRLEKKRVYMKNRYENDKTGEIIIQDSKLQASLPSNFINCTQ